MGQINSVGKDNFNLKIFISLCEMIPLVINICSFILCYSYTVKNTSKQIKQNQNEIFNVHTRERHRHFMRQEILT